MREFIRRAITKAPHMNEAQLRDLFEVLVEEYSLLDSMMDSLSTGLILSDSKHLIVKTNRATARILGFPLTENKELPVWNCIANKKLSDFIFFVIDSKASRTTKDFAFEKENEIQYVEVSVLPLVKEKKIQGTIIIIEDVTLAKREEIQKRRLENLASLTNVAAAVAHEIKNPLAAISIHLQLFRKNFNAANTKVDEKANKHLDVIQEEIERLNNIVVDFLFAVRPLKFEFYRIDINTLVESLKDTFNEEFHHAQIHFSVNLEKDLPLVYGDERFLRQTFINILTNAKAAMPTGGILSITTKTYKESVLIVISDTGEGIPKDLLHKIFEPYFTTKADGTGLGLTMSYKVVKEHGGDIHVKSTVGKGSSFSISLPILRKGEPLLLGSNYKKNNSSVFPNDSESFFEKV